MQDLFIEKPGFIEVITTVGKKTDAEKIARKVVEDKLAACVQIIPEVNSIYHWQGKIVESDELILVFKTKMNIYGKLVATLKTIHPYELPEIIVRRILEGSSQYLQWIDENTLD